MSVLCCGMLVADMLAYPVTALPPKGQGLGLEHAQLTTGGCALNTAIVLHRLQVPTRLVGCVGTDALGRFVVDSVQAVGLDVKGISLLESVPTATTIVTIDRSGERSFLHLPGANQALAPSHIVPWMGDKPDILHVGGCLLLRSLLDETLADLLARARRRGMMTSVDTVWDLSGRWLAGLRAALPHIDILFANLEEAQLLTGRAPPDAAAEDLAAAGTGTVIVKLGAAGAGFMAGGRWTTLAGHRVPAVDTTGAGDAFVAAYLAGVRRGLDAEACCRLANAAGAAAVTGFGATGGIQGWQQIEDLLTG